MRGCLRIPVGVRGRTSWPSTLRQTEDNSDRLLEHPAPYSRVPPCDPARLFLKRISLAAESFLDLSGDGCAGVAADDRVLEQPNAEVRQVGHVDHAIQAFLSLV